MSARERLLDHARRLFAAHGYQRTSLRMISSAADVDVALIAHYFGNKHGLYEVATRLPMDPQQLIDSLADVPLDQLGSTIAELFLGVWETPAGAGVLAEFRSMFDRSPDDLLKLLDTLLWRHVRQRLVDAAIDQPALRVELVLSTLFGTATLRKFLSAPELSAIGHGDLAAVLGPVLQGYLTGELPTDPPRP